jgi:hypothetical protein
MMTIAMRMNHMKILWMSKPKTKQSLQKTSSKKILKQRKLSPKMNSKVSQTSTLATPTIGGV